jgi:hypothetical protein
MSALFYATATHFLALSCRSSFAFASAGIAAVARWPAERRIGQVAEDRSATGLKDCAVDAYGEVAERKPSFRISLRHNQRLA